MDTWHYQTSPKHCMKTLSNIIVIYTFCGNWRAVPDGRWSHLTGSNIIKYHQHHQNIIKHYQTLSNIIIKHAKLESVELELRATKLSKGISETYHFLEGGEQGGKRSKIWWSSSSWSRIGSWQGVGKKPPRTSPYKDRGQAAPVKSSRAGQTHHLWMVNDRWSSLLYLPLSSSIPHTCPVLCLPIPTTNITINLVTPSFQASPPPASYLATIWRSQASKLLDQGCFICAPVSKACSIWGMPLKKTAYLTNTRRHQNARPEQTKCTNAETFIFVFPKPRQGSYL